MVQNENIQTASGSFGKKQLDRLFCYTKKIVAANFVLGVDPTLQHGRAKRITTTIISNAVRCGGHKASQVETVYPQSCSISFCKTCFMLQLPVDYKIEFLKSLQNSIVWKLVALDIWLK
jgi:hypothetical protein